MAAAAPIGKQLKTQATTTARKIEIRFKTTGCAFVAGPGRRNRCEHGGEQGVARGEQATAKNPKDLLFIDSLAVSSPPETGVTSIGGPRPLEPGKLATGRPYSFHG
jgi:hypothetical protein